MAELKRRIRWKKWAPDLGENRELPGGPVLHLELAVDLTAEQLEGSVALLREGLTPTEGVGWREMVKRAFAGALGPYVRVHGGPHTVDGKPLATLDDYIALVTESADAGLAQLKELQAALVSFNSLEGPDELFSLRRSGGARSTDAQSNDSAASPTDVR